MKKTIAVFFGGKSTEHDISIITALSAVIKPLELSGQYTVLPVYIAKNGSWYSDKALKDISIYRTGSVEDLCSKLKPLGILFDDGLILQKNGFKREKIKIDIAFPAMHGSYGEDGSLMGLLRMAGVPFVGSDMSASVVAMDKVLAKQVASANHIPVTKFQFFTKSQFTLDTKTILENIIGNLQLPLFVKPAHLGSSIGITKVTSFDELQNAIEVAVYYDDKVIVEEAVNNLVEVTVPIIGNEELQEALVEQPLISGSDFFDFDTKYMNGGKKSGGKKSSGAQGYSQLPADISKPMYKSSVDTAKAMYVAAGCEGIARVDLLIDSKSEVVYFNEINPLPGSLYAHNWRVAGLSNVDLVAKLVELAESRFIREQKIQQSFKTSFLKQF